ncbi:hypothetical protein QTP86_010846 [Hemibagrus guttatus]|nr:hypothetical protein QTP86_010846 [Hemibagrus guttatus]
MKSGKAVGPDDIPVEVWKCLGEAAVEFLANLFNRVLESERMPEEWRRSVLVPIFKNKGDVQSCSNYRGIKLMSHTMKLWERVVEARLRKVVDICEQQYGFMPRKSTTDAIFALRILMEKYRDGQRELHCVFVDLEKAYDRVPREELWYCMRKSGVAEKYVRVVQDMYERSRTVVRFAVGQTEEFKVEVGLHQGSALSPFLFAMVMDQLSEEVRQESPWTIMFADDIVICSESREQVEENLERWRFALERRGMEPGYIRNLVCQALGCRIALDMPGANSKQVGAIDRAYRSSTLLREAKTKSRAIFRLRNFSEADSMGSKGASSSPSRTAERSQEGSCGLQEGLSRLAPHRKRETRGCLLKEAPRTRVFLIPYLVFLFACGIPLFLLEMSIGQYTSQGGISCWRKICPLFQVVSYHGLAATIIGTLVVYFTATFPYVMLVVLLVHGLMLPGAAEGIRFYLYPDITHLKDPQVWLDAGTQILYSYGLCTGCLTALGSYNKYNNNFYKDCIYLCLLNSGTSFVAGFAIFSVLGFMAYEQETDISTVAESGPGLAFIAYPRAVAMMPVPQLWATCFFLMIVLLGVDTEFVGLETLMTVITDLYPSYLLLGYRRELALLFICVGSFLIGLVMVTEVRANSLYDNIEDMIGYRPLFLIKYFWKYITPLVCTGTFVFSLVKFTPLKFNNIVEYPWWGYAIGWYFTLSSTLLVPLWMIYALLTSSGSFRQANFALLALFDFSSLRGSNTTCCYLPGIYTDLA